MAEPIRLDLLEPEVLAMILEYVDDTSRQTSLAVSLTCKYLASVMRRISYRHKTLYIKSSGKNGLGSLPEMINKWSKDDMFLVNVRTLTVDGHLPKFPKLEETLENKDLWKPLIQLMSKISRLRLLTWNLAAIPIPVLDAFHTHQPFAKLRLFKYQPSIDLQPSARDKALARSPALTHIRSVLTSLPTSPNPNMQETALRRIVGLAPLEYAGIVNWIGNPIAGEPQRKIPFRTSQKPNSSIRFLTLDGYNLSKETLEDWSSIVDLKVLENVKCSRGLPDLSYFENAPSMLPNLKHVSLNLRQISSQAHKAIHDAVQHYLSSCSPLESLSLWSWIGIVDLKSILGQHGPTLKSLQLHERETSYQIQRRQILTVDQLKDILTSCPNLKELTFDLDRQASVLDLNNDDSNIEYFTTLRESKLNHLQIYFDQGLPYIYNHIDTVGGIISWDYNNEVDDEEEEDEQEQEQEEADNDNDESDNQEEELEDDNARENGGEAEGGDDSEPSTKRLKRSNVMLKPSTDMNLKSYVESIWKHVFATSMTARRLDIKIGEWESIHARRESVTLVVDSERKHARFLTARPAERDDEKEQCTITMKKA